MFFRSIYFGSLPFFMSCYFTKLFVRPLIIAAVCNINVGAKKTFSCSKSTIKTKWDKRYLQDSKTCCRDVFNMSKRQLFCKSKQYLTKALITHLKKTS